MRHIKKIIAAVLALTPSFAFAAGLDNVLLTIQRLLNLATPIVVALALLYFFWGLANYILSAGDTEKREEGRNIMIWGVIALFVMVSVWGLVRVIGDTFGIQEGGSIFIPTVPGRNSAPSSFPEVISI